MKRWALILCFLFVAQFAFADLPWFENTVVSLNLRADKLVDGFFKRFETIDEMKPFLADFNEVFKKNVGFNPRADLKNIGIMLTLEVEPFALVAYLDGHFNPAKIMAEFEAAAHMIPPVARKKIEIKEFQGKRMVVFTDEKKKRSFAGFFHSNRLFLMGESQVVESLVKGTLPVKMQVDNRRKLNLKNDLCLWINTDSLKNTVKRIKHPAAGPLSGMIAMFVSVEASINENDVKLSFECAGPDTAENLKAFLEGQIAGYKMFIDSQIREQKLPSQEKQWLPKAFKVLFARAMALTAKKTLSSAKIVKQKENVLFSATMPPLSETLLNPVSIGAVGVLGAIAIPNFQRARAKARERKCFNNQKRLLAAVNDYNDEHDGEKIGSITRESLAKLVKAGALSVVPECSDGGKYISVGDVARDGMISCTKHGPVNK
jgi:hypothetical protein